MPVSKSLRSSGPITGSLSALSADLPRRAGFVPRQQPPRARKRRVPLPPRPLVDEDARSDADDGESPPRAPLRSSRAPTADESETDAEATRAAFDALRDVLRKRGNKDPNVLELAGWTATCERNRPHSGSGWLQGWRYTFTDQDGETYTTLVSAACAAELRASGEEEPSLLEETFWEDVRHKRFEELKWWERPAALRHVRVPPPPDDPVPGSLGGFDAAYGDDWTRDRPHPQFVRDDVAAMGGDMDDDRCCRPRTALAVACQAAKMRPPVHRRNVTPNRWREGLLELADKEPDQARREVLRELERAATTIDRDCREAAKETAKRDWPAPRCCHVLAMLCVFVIRTTEHRAVRIMDCEARLGDDDKIKLTWHGPNKPFDLDHLSWTEIARVWASGRVCYLFGLSRSPSFHGLAFSSIESSSRASWIRATTTNSATGCVRVGVFVLAGSPTVVSPQGATTRAPGRPSAASCPTRRRARSTAVPSARPRRRCWTASDRCPTWGTTRGTATPRPPATSSACFLRTSSSGGPTRARMTPSLSCAP